MQCSQRDSPSVLRVGQGIRSPSLSWREFCPGLMAVGRGMTAGLTTRLQSVSDREAGQISADPHSSPTFKQRICSPPQSLIIIRSGSEENNYSVIAIHSRNNHRRWKNRNLGHYALFRLYPQTGVVVSRLKTI